MHQWLVFLHVAAVMAFMLVHGVQVAVMWKERWEPDPERNLALFGPLPGLALLRLSGLAVILTGLALVATRSLWDRWWVWLSLLLLGAIWLLMRRYGGGYYNLIERAATRAIETRGSADEADARAAFSAARLAWHPIGMTAIGLGGFAVILWLMIFTPF